VQLGATPRHVLLVEDACDSRVITRAFLRREGYEVTSVETGEAAIALYADSQRFSALITDYGLPDTTGIRLIGELRRLRANLPAVLISGYLSFDRDSTLPDGVVKLVKPFSRDALLKAVAATIRTADPSSASPASKMDCLFL
jgi:CheY-like chemotaxis protein